MTGDMFRNVFPRELSRDRERDGGIGLAVAALVAGRIWDWPRLIDLSIALLLLSAAVPAVLRPFVRAWVALTRLLGAALSLALLCLSFAFLVVPIGLARRIAGVDDLQSRKWRGGSSSVFSPRQGAFCADDLERPY